MLLYVVVYNIPCDKRRKKLSNILEGYGRRVQYSVFECVLTASKFDELRCRLKKRVKLPENSVRFYPVSKHTLANVETWGGVSVTECPGSLII